MAMLTVYDTDDGSSVQFFSPIVYAENSKGQAIQVLGSTHTYLRRYLWLLAMEIVEADTVDAEKQEEKKEPVRIPKVVQGTVSEDNTWFMRINAEDGCTNEQWITAVRDAAEVAMELAKSATDVTTIYAKNKAIFTKLKEMDANAHTELVAKFAAAKKSFKG
jgi:hypothetical protein